MQLYDHGHVLNSKAMIKQKIKLVFQSLNNTKRTPARTRKSWFYAYVFKQSLDMVKITTSGVIGSAYTFQKLTKLDLMLEAIPFKHFLVFMHVAHCIEFI